MSKKKETENDQLHGEIETEIKLWKLNQSFLGELKYNYHSLIIYISCYLIYIYSAFYQFPNIYKSYYPYSVYATHLVLRENALHLVYYRFIFEH